MQFEGTQVNIPIKGIMRAGTDNLSADGAMNEVIGMEYKDGSWLPYKTTDEDWTVYVQNIHGTYSVVTGITKAYVHKTSDGEQHYIYYIGEYGALFYELGRDEDAKYVYCKRLVNEGVKDVEFVGNMLCVATDEGVLYFIWEEGRYYPYQINYYPSVNFRVTDSGIDKDGVQTNVVGLRHVSKLLGESQNTTSEAEIPRDTKKSQIISGLAAVIGEVKERGGLTGYHLVCAAYRAKNGSIIAASAPVLVSKPCRVYGDKEENMLLGAQTQFVKSIVDSTFEHIELLRTPVNSNYAVVQFPCFPDTREGLWENLTDYQTKEGFLEIKTTSSRKCATYETVDYVDGAEIMPIPERSIEQGDRGMYAIIEDQNIDDIESTYRALNIPFVPTLVCTATKLRLVHNPGTTGTSTRIDYIFSSYATYNMLQYRIEDDDFSDRRDVESLCIFLSPEISPYNLELEKVEDFDKIVNNSGGGPFLFDTEMPWSMGPAGSNKWYMGFQSYFAKEKSYNEMIEDLKNINNLYLVEEIPVEKIPTVGDWITIDLEGKLGDKLVTRESLPLSAFDRNTIIPSNIDSYNYRAHEFDYRTKLFNGYRLPEMGYYGGTRQLPSSLFANNPSAGYTKTYKWEIQVTIRNNNGDVKVVNYDNAELASLIKSLSPIITYPSNDAQSIKIRVYVYDSRDTSSGFSEPEYGSYSETYEAEFQFNHDSKLGIAYYVDPELKPIIPQILRQ